MSKNYSSPSNNNNINSIITSPSSLHNSIGSINTLRDEKDEKQKLEKTNFDLKMKLFYLEENMRKNTNDISISNIEGNNQNLMIIEDLKIKLEERNILLTKAKNAMESLSNEVNRLRNDKEKNINLDNINKQLKKELDDNELNSRSNIAQMESKLLLTQQIVNEKENLIKTLKHKLKEIEVEIDTVNQRFILQMKEKDDLEQKLIIIQHKNGDLEEDILQQNAINELFKIQLDEKHQENIDILSKYNQSLSEITNIHAENKQRIADLNNQYETQFRTMRSLHEDEIEKLRKSHSLMIQDIRTNYQGEITKVKENDVIHLEEIKAIDAQKLEKERKTISILLAESKDETLKIKNELQVALTRLHSNIKENENMKIELKNKNDLLQEYKDEIGAKGHEVANLSKNIQLIEELRVIIEKNLTEKNHLITKLEQLTEKNKMHKDESIKYQLENVSLSKDCSHYIKEIEDLLSKSNTVVHISVENEKLKNSNNELNSKLIKESHKIDLLKNDIKTLNEYNINNKDIIDQLNSIITENNVKIKELTHNISQLQQEQNVKKSIITDLEINLENKINIIKGLDKSLSHESLLRESAEKSYNMTQSLYNEVEDDAVVSCNMAYNAMSLWNSILGDVLDYDGKQASSMTITKNDNHSISDKQGKLKENITIMIDRIQNKCERMKRIHSIFQSKSSRMFSSIESIIDKSNERASLAFSEVKNLTNELNMVKNTVERDRKQRQEEINDMKEFREKILIENNNNIRLSESKLSTITNNYEREKSQNQTLSETISNLHNELKSVQEINQELRIELENYFNIEETIKEMKDRIINVTELNNDLQSEITEKDEVISNLVSNQQDDSNKKNNLMSIVEDLKNEITKNKMKMGDSASVISNLKEDIVKLKARQIDPALVKTILDTQSMIRLNSNGNNHGFISTSENNFNQIGSLNDKLMSTNQKIKLENESTNKEGNDNILVSDNLIIQLDSITITIGELLNKTQLLLTRFERNHSNNDNDDIYKDLYELLNNNSQLMMKLNNLALDYKKIYRKVQSSSDANKEFKDYLLNEASTTGNSYNNAQVNDKSLSISLHKKESFSNVTSQSKISSPSTKTTTHSTNTTHNNDHINTSSPNTRLNHYLSMNNSSPSSSPLTTIDLHTSSHIKNKYIHEEHQDKDTFNYRHMFTPNSSNRHSTNRQSNRQNNDELAVFTPNYTARQSITRLTKLESDLQLLSRKLDSFDKSR